MKDVETLVLAHLNREAQAVRFDAARWEDRVSEGRRRPRLPGIRAMGIAAAAVLLVAGVAVPLVLVSGLRGPPAVDPGGRSIAGYGLRMDLPEGWDGRVRGPAGVSFGPHLHAANFPLPETDDDVASRARSEMTDEQVTIVVIDVTTALARDVRGPQDHYEQAELPVRIRADDFTDRVEAVDPDHAFARRSFSVANRSFQVWMEFGTDPAPDPLVAEANAVLSTLAVESVGEASGYRRHADIDDGLAITIPDAWTFHQDPTRPIEPKNVFAVGSWAFPRGGGCAPTAAQDELPRDGVLFWLIEYHGDQPVADFPERPERFELDRQTLGVYECSTVPSYMIRFRAAGRFFQVHVAFGPDASESLEPEVLQALESLEVLTPDCPTRTSYEPEVIPAAGPPGTSVEVTGAIATGGNEGGGWGSPATRVEAWWNLKPAQFGSVLTGNPEAAGPGPVESLGTWVADGGCSYDISFEVPTHETVTSGSYPVVLLISGPDVGGPSYSAQSVMFEVTD
jgi:hypothetical protein